MKRIITLLFVLFFCSPMLKSQMTVMFVNDNSAFPPNTETVLATLGQTSFSVTLFDAVAENRSPEYLEMQSYDLVIWYLGSDGVGRWFWNGTDSDNEQLKQYLQQGGKLWLMGTDFMYDRYGTPWLFQAGDFAYDYLGVGEYHAQSYGDDGNLGVPQLDLAEGISWLTLNPVNWTFATLWWVDAMVPAPTAEAVYMMGPQSYSLSSYASALFVSTTTHQTLSFFFDPALIDSDANRLILFNEVLGFFNSSVGIDQLELNSAGRIQVIPNPASTDVVIQLPKSDAKELLVFDINGRLVDRIFIFQETSLEINVRNYQSGIYTLKADQYLTKMLVK